MLEGTTISAIKAGLLNNSIDGADFLLPASPEAMLLILVVYGSMQVGQIATP